MLFLSVIPKSIMNLTANPVKILELLNSSYDWKNVDVYNDIIVPAQGIITILIQIPPPL